LAGSLSFEGAVVKQQTVRQLTNQTLNFEQIGQLAWAGLGMTEATRQTGGPQQSVSTAIPIAQPAREIYPIMLYVVVQDGIYLYNPNEHNLRQTYNRDVRGALASATMSPEVVATAGCSIIITGPVKDPTGRPAAQARRLMYLQAGQVAQSIQLQAVSLNLASVPVSDFNARNIIRICNLQRNQEAVYIISVGYPAETTSSQTASVQQPSGVVPSAQNRTAPRTAVLIASQENFDDRELFETMRVLNTMGVQTVIASIRLGVIRGMMGGIAEAGILLSQLRTDDYDAVIFIGGDGAREYFNNPDALNIARQTASQGKVLAAISTAPTILANAGVLRGVRATAYLTERAVLQKAGATYTGNHVERDGLIITSTGPIAVVQFAGAIAEALAGR
jgi:protease I